MTPRHAQTPLAIVIQIDTRDYVVDRYTSPVQKFVTIRPGVSFPRMRDFAHQNVLVFFFGGGGLQLATAKGRGRILTRNTPKHADPPKDVPFRGCEHKI